MQTIRTGSAAAGLPWLCMVLSIAAAASARAETAPEPPFARMAVSRAVATENTQQPVLITVELDRPAPDSGLDIVLDLAGGTARPGEDFHPPTQGLRIAPGASAGSVSLSIIDDQQSEPDEVVRIVVRPGDGYRVGEPHSFDLLIRDDDDDPESLGDRLRELVQNTPDPLIASQIDALARLCATSRPPPGSDLDRRCQLLRLALRDPGAIPQLIGALRGAIGEELSSQRRGFRMLATGQLGALNRRLQAVRGGNGAGIALTDFGMQTSMGFLPFAAQVADDGELLGRGIGVFASGTLGDGRRDATELENGYDSDGSTLLLGLDKRFGDRWVVGLTYTRTEFDADLDAGAGELALDQNAFGLYFSYGAERFWLDGSAGIGRGEVRQERLVRFEASSEEETLSAVDRLLGSPDADQRYATLSAGLDYAHHRWSFGPRLALEYARLDIDAFSERAIEGGDAFAVAIDAQRLRSLIARAGASASAAFSTGWGVLQPQIELSWVGQFEDDAEALSGYFINDPQQQRFTLPTSAIDSRYGEVAVGLSGVFANGWSGFVSYRRLFSVDDSRQQFWSFGLRAEF